MDSILVNATPNPDPKLPDASAPDVRSPAPRPVDSQGLARRRVPGRSLVLSDRANRLRRLTEFSGRAFLFLVTSSSALAVLFIFYFILKDALPFFQLRGIRELLTGLEWYPSGRPPAFGALAIFYGSGIVTLGAILVAVPLGVAAAACLSDVLPFSVRQLVKPVIEILAAIPSVAYGFFALVVFAPALQEHGGRILATGAWLIGAPLGLLAAVVLSDLATNRIARLTGTGVPRSSCGLSVSPTRPSGNLGVAPTTPTRLTGGATPNPPYGGLSVSPARPSGNLGVAPAIHTAVRLAIGLALGGLAFFLLWRLGAALGRITIASGTNALNVSVVLGIMALPTVVSVSEDALQAVGRELREGSYALGATRAETVLRVVIPAASSGIAAAAILGVMRAIGETMVVWMASGNACQIPKPWYDVLQPVRTLTATIAGDMGEADQTTGSARFHVLFALALALLTISFVCNLLSELAVRRAQRRTGT